MDLKDFAYLYSKYYVTTLSEIIFCEENWAQGDHTEDYRAYAKQFDRMFPIVSLSKDPEASMKGVSANVLKDRIDFFEESLLKTTENNIKLSPTIKTDLKVDIKLLRKQENLSFIKFLKEIRKLEAKHFG